MALRKLTPEEDAVFEAIVKQRSSITEDCFCYDFAEAEKFLCDTGASIQLGLGQPEQAAIIRKLTQDGIITADWPKTINSKVIKGEFTNNSSWIPASIKLSNIIDGYGPDVFCVINISFSHIKLINDACRARYNTTLSYNDRKMRFEIACTNTNEKLVIKKIKSGMRPYEVLKIATQNPKTVITRNALNKYSEDSPAHIGKLSIATQVFDDESIVRNELSPFVELTNESIKVNPTVNITLNELKAIRQICF